MTPAFPAVSLRPATEDDCASLAALSIEVWLGTYLFNGINRVFSEYLLVTYTPGHFSKALQNPAEHLIVSQNQEGIDGYIRISHGRPSPAGGPSRTEISTLNVQPRHQGKSIGRDLLAAGLQTCRSKAWDAPWLAANPQNQRAIAFYLRHGFEPAGLTHFQIQDNRYPNEVLQYCGSWPPAET
ncbi:GNAT family N-acetyltransferase [Leisingera sp. D0M16]|uniref:GNAT family N-acetyltransferase n=1 Tax=Leisingera coralii TaxID=3351347 RepID=UPI003B7C04F6